MERDLWKVERYDDFLMERRRLLAEAANEFLESLYHGSMTEPDIDAHSRPPVHYAAWRIGVA